MVKATDVKTLREKTGAGFMDCKEALAEADGDLEKAIKVLQKRDVRLAAKKSEREASEGVIGTYLHSNDRIGVLVEVNCETDFVARNDEFKKLAHELAVHIAATTPEFVSENDITKERIAKEKKIVLAELKDEKKPKDVLDKIIDGKLKKFKKEIALLCQPFYKNDEKTVQDVITEKIGKLGEHIEVKRFIRYQM